MGKKKVALRVLVVFLVLIFLLLSVRLISDRELDDVSPGISCSDELLLKSDILWVVPYYEDKPISDDIEWCNSILDLDKTLGLHGVDHSYGEFRFEKDREYVLNGVEIFEECFGFKPEIFKAPHLALSSENKKLVESFDMKVSGKFNQLTSKVYHCSDTGKFSNRFIDLF